MPGTLLAQETIATSIPGACAWRIRYASRDVHGLPTEVTGLVVAPVESGEDRPLLAWCHGTTGLGDSACPSAQPDPARELTTYFTIESTASIDYGIPGLTDLISHGWVVCATDYQGLGTPGMHHYLVNRSNARDAINIVHAARALVPSCGNQVAGMGWSQGGGTAAALAELDGDDYADLSLIGTVAMSPGVPTIALAHPSGPSAALASSDVVPDAHLVMLIAGCAAANPDLSLGDMLTPLGVSIVEGAWQTQPVHHLNDTITRLFHFEGPIIDVKPEAMPAWKSAMAAGSAAQRKPICPVLVCIDGLDGGSVVPVTWQRQYVDAIHALGGHVESRDYPRDDHFSLPASCAGDARAWLSSLLA